MPSIFNAKHLQIDGLPDRSEVHHIEFVERNNAKGDREVLLDLPGTMPHLAIVSAGQTTEPIAGRGLILLAIPSENHSDAPAFDAVREWVSNGGQKTDLMTLQGIKAIWSGTRFAIYAPESRLLEVRKSIVESVFYETELTAIEQQLRNEWPQLESDMPLAFEFKRPTRRMRKRYLKRFLQIQSLRIRQMRIAPKVNCPHLHPPTLASQFSERYRERTQLDHRFLVLDQQLDVFETTYNHCAQRAADSGHARTGHWLEWAIIILLLIQVVIYCVEFLNLESRVLDFLPGNWLDQ